MSSQQPNYLSSLNSVTICVVDDSRAFSAGLKEFLITLQCNVHTFNDPALALKEIIEIKPDIVITDFEMPVMSGIEFTQNIRQTEFGKYVPLLMLTGKDDAETLVSAIHAGADAFVSKSNIRNILPAQLLALNRLNKLNKDLTKSRQLEAVQSLIGTYKHEFGNVLTILYGKAAKLERDIPTIAKIDTYKSIVGCFKRLEETLKKLNELRNYQESIYSEKSKIIKIA